MNLRQTLLGIVVWLLASTSLQLLAQNDLGIDAEQDIFRDVAVQLRCPTCVGLSVLDSEAKFSVQIKDEVKRQLGEGKSKQEILAYFNDRYGPWILRSPPSDGVNALVWWIPILLLVLGPLGVFMLVWGRRKEVPSYGVRSYDQIVGEMQQQIEGLRNQKKES